MYCSLCKTNSFNNERIRCFKCNHNFYICENCILDIQENGYLDKYCPICGISLNELKYYISYSVEYTSGKRYLFRNFIPKKNKIITYRADSRPPKEIFKLGFKNQAYVILKRH